MKRLIALILLCFMPGLASAQGYPLVEYEGVAYEYNPQITTSLYAGIDSTGPITTTDR